MTAPSLMAALRAATTGHHERTERLVPALDPALLLDGYARILARFRAAYAPMEARLSVVAWPDGFDWSARRKVPLLDADLAWLAARGVAVPDVPPVAPAAPAAATLAAAIGTLYVLEGASLGGQLIVRRLGPRLGVDAGAGASFYAGYGARTGPMWKAFAAMAEHWGAGAAAEWDAVIASAQAAFDAIAVPFER